jgi:RHS repeat-associated protein
VGSQPGNPITNYCWSYDAFGNRLQQIGSDQAIAGGGGAACQQQAGANIGYTAWADYSANNQFTQTSQAQGGVQYDASGDIVADGSNQYLYNADGQICAVHNMTGMTEYIYDAEGRRVAEGGISSWSCDTATNGFTVTADYVRDQAGNQLSEFAPGQGGTMVWQHTNVYANGELIATEDNTEAHFYLNDWLGTRRVQTDYLGVTEQTCSSLPYGDGETCAPTPTENLFTGQERDAESGNDYFGARYYASTMGRFLSPDSDDDDDDPEPLSYADFTNPQTLNLYIYAQNRPLTNLDYDGHASWQPCANDTSSQCWTGDYNGERDCSGSSGCIFWNGSTHQWQKNDPTALPESSPWQAGAD